MTLLLNDDQQMLQEAARNFCQKHTPVSQLRKLRDEKSANGFDAGSWQQMVELGWPGISLPEAYGGFEFGHAGLGLVLQETGRTLTCSPLIATVLIGANLLNELGDEACKLQYLPKVVAGELLLALALDEQPIHQPVNVASNARLDGDEYVLNGSKTFVLDGHIADLLLVVARTSGASGEQSGLSVFLVDADSAGVKVTRTLMVDNRNAAKVTLQDVRVPAENLLGDAGEAFPALERVLDIARIGLAAEMLGSCEEVFSRTVEYLNQRQQFGVLIGAFQSLQHRAAIMYSELELCKSIVLAALMALDDPDKSATEIGLLASAAKAKLSEVAELISNEGVQMHGGIGMTDEFDIGFYIKRARVAQQFLGDAAFHRDRYAALSGF